jgi:sarcosine oxidase subunit gamma
MSDAISALKGAESTGYVTVREAGLCGMVTLRGDLGSAALKKAVKAAVGTEVPEPRQIVGTSDHGAAWMSPDELMLFCAHDKAAETVAAIGKALAGEHHLVADVSDARAVFDLEGLALREVLAKLTPADVAPGRLEPGEVRRSRLAQVPAAFWLTGPDSARVVCFRSVAQYAFDLLTTASLPGSEVGLF